MKLSVVVTIVCGKQHLSKCLDALTPQAKQEDIEIIVPYDIGLGDFGEIQSRYPDVLYVDMGEIKISSPGNNYGRKHEIYDMRTANGIKAARGEIVGLLHDYVYPDSNWCTQVLSAHEIGHGVIGGIVEQKGEGILNWAAYFLDFGRYQPPLAEGPVNYLTDVNVTYKREALEAVFPLWSDRYNEVVVNWKLAKEDFVLWREPKLIVYHDRGNLSLRRLINERFYWGRLFGSVRIKEISRISRFLYIIFSPFIPLVLMARLCTRTIRAGRYISPFITAIPVTILLILVWSLGEWAGYLTGKE